MIDLKLSSFSIIFFQKFKNIGIDFLKILWPSQHFNMNISLKNFFFTCVFRKTEKTENLKMIYLGTMYVCTIYQSDIIGSN